MIILCFIDSFLAQYGNKKVFLDPRECTLEQKYG
jgi:hypothetical protein